MITLSRRQILSIRTTVSQALGITSRRSKTPIGFQTCDAGITVAASNETVAISHTIPGAQTPSSLALPLAALKECEGRSDEHVTFRQEADTVIVEWHDTGIPQSTRHDAGEQPVIPNDVESLTSSDASLITALKDAVETSDRESTRYALDCIQLRGNGQIVATDSRQAFVQGGFNFPWADNLLVPASRVLCRKEFASAEEVAIGNSDEWVMVRAGAWRIWLKINKQARFPDVEDRILNPDAATTTLRLDNNDASFLAKAISRLPGARASNAPVTLDLNGQVALRAQGDGRDATELQLSRSRRDGKEIRCNTNRKYLARAVQLGFRDVHFHSPEAPAVCRDGDRTYFWAMLGKEGAIQPSDRMQRITSDDHGIHHQQLHHREARKTMATEQTDKREKQGVETEAVEEQNPLEAAEALRDSLKQSLACTRELITSLRKRKKQSRLVESTLASLRQLHDVA